MAPWRLLVVDDQAMSLKMIAKCLDGQGYDIDYVANGEEALAKLTQASPPYDLLLLDRVMPGIDGLQVLRHIKADPAFADLPVILQTSSTSPAQVREGMDAGAYFYLTKPYDCSALCAIVHAALEEVGMARREVRTAAEEERLMHLISQARFRIATIAEAQYLAARLALLAPRPDAVAIGLTELLVNGVEHGNLGLSYEEKLQLRREDRWEEELERRASLPEYVNRRVTITVNCTNEAITYIVSDEGKGFEFSRYLQFDPDRAFDLNGRGIALARAMSFSSIEYKGAGNLVEARVDLSGTKPT